MSPAQRIALNTLALVMLILAIILIVQNIPATFPLIVAGETYPDVSAGGMMAACAGLITGSVLLKIWEQAAMSQRSQQKISRQLERSEISAEVSSDKVKALESKIQTLETALAEALKRSGTVKTPQPPATSQQVPETAP